MTVPASCEKHQALVGRSVSEVNGQIWLQKQMSLSPRSRGFHLITREILTALPELRQMETGLLHIFILH